MRAAVFQGPEDIRVAEAPDPTAAAGGVLVRVRSCAICGSDLRTYQHGSSMLSPPWIIGHEIAGEIIETSGETAGLRPGDRIAVAAAVPCGACRACRRGWGNMCHGIRAHGFDEPGGFAQLMAVSAHAIAQGAVNKIPDHVSFEEASLAEPLACVVNGQELVDVGLGDVVVVIGAGPIGCLHVEVARARGAARVIQAEANPLRLRQAAAFGADVLIDAAAEDVAARVREETEGRGADVVIVACGSKAAQAEALHMAAPRGRVSFFGGLPKNDSVVALDGNVLHYKELSVVGAFSSSPAQNRTALDLIASGRVRAKAMIGGSLPLDDIVSGFEAMKRGEALKLVVAP